MTLVWLKCIAFQKKTKSRFWFEKLKKSSFFQFLWQNFFEKRNYDFHILWELCKLLVRHCSCVFEKDRVWKEKQSWFGVEKLKKVFTFGKVLKSRTGTDFFFRGKHGLGQIHKSNEEKKDSKILIKSEIIIHFSQKKNSNFIRIMISFFSFFLELWNLFLSALLLCFWKRPWLKRKKRVGSILRFWKKLFTFSFFFEFFLEMEIIILMKNGTNCCT